MVLTKGYLDELGAATRDVRCFDVELSQHCFRAFLVLSALAFMTGESIPDQQTLLREEPTGYDLAQIVFRGYIVHPNGPGPADDEPPFELTDELRNRAFVFCSLSAVI